MVPNNQSGNKSPAVPDLLAEPCLSIDHKRIIRASYRSLVYTSVQLHLRASLESAQICEWTLRENKTFKITF